MSQCFAGGMDAMCSVNKGTEFLSKRVKRFLLGHTLQAKPAVKSLKLSFTTVVVSTQHGSGLEARGDYEGSFGRRTVFAKIAMISSSIWMSPIESSDFK